MRIEDSYRFSIFFVHRRRFFVLYHKKSSWRRLRVPISLVLLNFKACKWRVLVCTTTALNRFADLTQRRSWAGIRRNRVQIVSYSHVMICDLINWPIRVSSSSPLFLDCHSCCCYKARQQIRQRLLRSNFKASSLKPVQESAPVSSSESISSLDLWLKRSCNVSVLVFCRKFVLWGKRRQLSHWQSIKFVANLYYIYIY